MVFKFLVGAIPIVKLRKAVTRYYIWLSILDGPYLALATYYQVAAGNLFSLMDL